ncbi:MAG: nuclear transport factor 2 family protein [Draconibacterium sp.]
MNKLTIISILFLLSFGFVTQAEGQTLSNRQTEQIKNQVDSVFQKMIVLAENLEFNKLSSGVHDTREAGFITNGKYYARYSSLIEDVKNNAQGISHQDISIKEKKITVLSDKIVLMTASGVAKANLNDGRVIAADFQWSFVYEKIDNEWKVIYSHQSTTR